MHDSSELPTQTHNYLRVPLNQAVFAALSPEVISTKKNLESYSADLRQCYFDEEKDLSHFRYYSRSNCEVECLGYLMENILGCLDFYLPRKFNENVIMQLAENFGQNKNMFSQTGIRKRIF